MLDLLLANPILGIIAILILLLSLSIHEFAHAWVADKLGDPTPRLQGRVTLNPLAHLDPLGTILLILARFGWGKPVEFDPFNLQHPVRDSALIAAAGPASNILIAIVIALLVRTPLASPAFTDLMFYVVLLNLNLAIFNLVPIPPLDGSRILTALLPRDLAFEFQHIMNQYGFFILLFLVLPIAGGQSPVSFLISPVVTFLTSLLLPI